MVILKKLQFSIAHLFHPSQETKIRWKLINLLFETETHTISDLFILARRA